MSEFRRTAAAISAFVGLSASLLSSSENAQALGEQHNRMISENLDHDRLAIARFGGCAVHSVTNGPLEGGFPERRELQVELVLTPTPQASQAMHRHWDEAIDPLHWGQYVRATARAPHAPVGTAEKVDEPGVRLLAGYFTPTRTFHPLANSLPGTEIAVSLASMAIYDGPTLYETGTVGPTTTQIATVGTIPCGTLTVDAAGNWNLNPPPAGPAFQALPQEETTIYTR